MKTLTPATRADNARFFNSDDEVHHAVPRNDHGRKECVSIAQGRGKAHAIAQSVEGPVTSMCPGSILQMHPKVTVVLDTEAASELTLTDYYRFVFNSRPKWQQ